MAHQKRSTKPDDLLMTTYTWEGKHLKLTKHQPKRIIFRPIWSNLKWDHEQRTKNRPDCLIGKNREVKGIWRNRKTRGNNPKTKHNAHQVNRNTKKLQTDKPQGKMRTQIKLISTSDKSGHAIKLKWMNE